MSGAAHRGDDDVVFYAADIGNTGLIAASTTSAQYPSDVEGPLEPGRYMIQVVNLSKNKAMIWIGAGPFVKGSPLVITAGPGKDKMPLSQQALVGIEMNVVKNYNDRVAAITSEGTADVYVTRVSRESRNQRRGTG